MEALLRDVRYGLRTLLKNPGFTSVAVVTLALGIGANTAIFSIVNAVLLRPLPYQDPNGLVVVRESWKGEGTMPAAWPKYLDWRAQNHVFEAIAGSGWVSGFTMSGRQEPEQILGLPVTASFFRLFHVQTLYGRTFLEEEEKPGHDQVVVLSYGLWQRTL